MLSRGIASNGQSFHFVTCGIYADDADVRNAFRFCPVSVSPRKVNSGDEIIWRSCPPFRVGSCFLRVPRPRLGAEDLVVAKRGCDFARICEEIRDCMGLSFQKLDLCQYCSRITELCMSSTNSRSKRQK